MNLAIHWRQHNKVRSIESIDMFTKVGYERLYNIQQGDVWAGYILDSIAPISRENNINQSEGYSMLTENKYKGKSSFLKSFYLGGDKPNY